MDFIDFCQIPTITVQDVINENYKPEDLAEMDMARKMATITALLSVDSENMPKIRKFIKELQGGDELCTKFDVQWAYGDEKRLEQLQEIKLEEQLEKQERTENKHRASEAKFSSVKGSLEFEQVDEMYQAYLAEKEKVKRGGMNEK